MSTIAALLLWLTLSRGLFYLPALPADARLQRVAQERADRIAATGYFGHCDTPAQLPGCTAAFVALDVAALPPGNYQIGENLWAGHGYADDDIGRAATLWWLASPGHLANIVNPAFRRVGFGLAIRQGPLTGGEGTPTTLPGPTVVIAEELGSEE